MEYSVLRGSNQIGGSVVEIVSKKGTKIWVDFGSELSVDEEMSTDGELIARMKDENTRPDAVFFTHIHGDHIGLLSHVEDGVHIYIGKVAKEMLDNIHDTLLPANFLSPKERETMEREQAILNNRDFVHFYPDSVNDTIPIGKVKGDISYTAVRVDHSVYDAYMLRFDADGQSIVHTGDFREHGRLGAEMENSLRKLCPKTATPVNVLITEGTMMSRPGEKVLKEKQLQEQATIILQNHKYAFLLCSSTNMESLASFYQAAKATNRHFYCNSYVKAQLDLYTKEVGKPGTNQENPDFIFDDVNLIYQAKEQYEALKNDGFVMLVGKTPYYQNLMNRYREEFGEDNVILFYSMWNGYLEPSKDYTDDLLVNIVSEWDENMVEKLHTSGHATRETIEKMISIVHPTTAIVPIHTERPNAFKSLKVDGYKDNDISHLVKIENDVIGNNFKQLYYGDKYILNYSKTIQCEWEENKLKLFISRPLENMQTDAAAFEGIICVLWSKVPDAMVELAFRQNTKWEQHFPLPTYVDKGGHERVSSDTLHYMRFLYRVMKFRERFGGDGRFQVAKANEDEVNQFEACYYDPANQYYVTKPGKNKSGIRKTNELSENHLEKWFVMHSRTNEQRENKFFDILKDAMQQDIHAPIKLYDQFPCRLFVNTKKESNKIFSSGYIDLWGIGNEGELCIFELKKEGFEPLGIISELFFYAMLACDMRNANVSDKGASYRGFNKFMASDKEKPVKAYFLAPSLHKEIMENLESILYMLSSEKDVIFDYIHFDQSQIVTKDTDRFLDKLRSDWENFDYDR